jgi:DNA-binding transcriptional LysR family regulator
MDLLRAMQTFVRIVDKGSLTAAADSLSISLPSVVRTLAALEAKVDARLLNRTTRRISLTDEGSEYLERCRRVLAEIDEAEASLSARRIAPKGRLRITAPVMFGRLRVAPAVLDFLTRHPALRVDVLLLDRVVDLVEEGIDVGIRIGRLPDSSLVAIPVGETRRVVCASASYLKRAGTPKSLAELARHRCVSFAGVSPGDVWRFADGDRPVQQSVEPVLTSNQFDIAIDACLRGAGLAQFLCYQVQALLDAGKLKRVLRPFEPAPAPIQVIYPQARRLSSNVRAFLDWAVPRLRARPSDRAVRST